VPGLRGVPFIFAELAAIPPRRMTPISIGSRLASSMTTRVECVAKEVAVRLWWARSACRRRARFTRSGRRFAEFVRQAMMTAERRGAVLAFDASKADYTACGGAAEEGTTLVLLGPHFGHV